MAITKIKLKNGQTRYRVRYREPGAPRTANPKTATFDTPGEAKDFEATLRGVKLPTKVVAKSQTLESFGVEYREKFAKVELAKSTLNVQRSIWNRHILPQLGSQPLGTLSANPELIQEWKAKLIANGVGDGAVRKALAILSAVMTKAVEWNRIPSNPVATIKKPSGKRKRRVQVIAPETVERLRDLMPTEADKRIISVLAYSGLRPGEALALEGSDVALKTISVDKALSLGETKGTKTDEDRIVPLLSPLRDDLTPRDTGLLFAREDGTPWRDHDYRNWRKRIFQPAAVAAGLGTMERTDKYVTENGKKRRKVTSKYDGIRPYDLRHTFASLLLAEGRNPIEVAEAMGHSPAILLSTYAHVIGELRGTTPVPAEDRIIEARVKSVSQKAVA